MRIIFYIIIILSFNFSFSLDLKSINQLNSWVILQEEPVKVDWLSFKGYPISRAEKLIEHNLNEIAEIIKDIDQYPIIFKRVTETKRLDSNIVHVMLDMPFPFSGRDYVIKYSSEKDENIWKFSFYAVDHPKGILKPGVVRLDNAAGIWILKGLSNNKTMVTYAWHGELLGNFPDFGLNKAWITQGTEVLTWLDKALSI